MASEISEEAVETLRLPKDWHSYLRTAVLNVIGVVRIAMLAGREALIENGDAKDAKIHQGGAWGSPCSSAGLRPKK